MLIKKSGFVPEKIFELSISSSSPEPEAKTTPSLYYSDDADDCAQRIDQLLFV